MRDQIQTQTSWFRNFGGVCQYPENTKTPQNLLSDSLNVFLNDRGELAPRTGHTKYFNSTTPDGKKAVSTFVADFRDTKKIIVATTDNVYEMSSTGFSLIYSIEAISAKPMSFCMVNANSLPVLVFGNGKINLKKWDGSIVANCGGGAPRGLPVAYKNYIAVFDIEGQPSGRIQFNALVSGISDPDTWVDPISGIYRYIDIGGEITAIVESFAMLIFCYNKAYLLTGDPESWGNLSKLPGTIGCVGQQQVIEADGNLVWIDRTGIFSWDGSGSFPTRKLSFSGNLNESNIGKDFDAIPKENLVDAAIAYSPLKKWLYISSRSYSTTYNSKTWIFDFVKQAWFPWSYGFSAFVFFEMRETEYRVGIDHKFYPLSLASSSDMVDNGDPFYYNIIFPDFSMDDINAAKIWRAIHIGARGTGLKIIRGIYYADFEDDPSIAEVDRFTLDRSMLDSRFVSMALDPGTISSIQNFTLSFDCGGFILGGRFEDGASRLDEGTLDPPKRYMIQRVPIKLRAKYLRLYIYGSEAGECVPINEIGIEWRYVSMRKKLVKESFT